VDIRWRFLCSASLRFPAMQLLSLLQQDKKPGSWSVYWQWASLRREGKKEEGVWVGGTSMAAISSRMTKSLVSKVARFSLTSSSRASALLRLSRTRETLGLLSKIARTFAACAFILNSQVLAGSDGETLRIVRNGQDVVARPAERSQDWGCQKASIDRLNDIRATAQESQMVGWETWGVWFHHGRGKVQKGGEGGGPGHDIVSLSSMVMRVTSFMTD